ncbi:MAG TPA: addiction module protein [Urbifossiella sp.]|jgi:putative addiction module component (TIGR02574 family)
MTSTAESLFQELMTLSVAERAEIVNRLWDDINDGDDSEIDLGPEWDEEIRRRIEDHESGKATGIPWEEVRKFMIEGEDGTS